MIDGEAVILGLDGVPDFNALHSRQHDKEVDRVGCRGIFTAPFEQGEIGPDLFRAACKLGLEGMVSKRRDLPYRPGRSPDWVKVKNRQHPAMYRRRNPFAELPRRLLD